MSKKDFNLPDYMSADRQRAIAEFIKKNNPAPAKSVVLRTLNRIVIWLSNRVEDLTLFLDRFTHGK